MKLSNWKSIEVCKVCEIEVKENTVFDHSCKYCGNSGEYSFSSIPVNRVIYRKISYNPSWMFWNMDVEYEGKNDYSKKWVDEYLNI